MTKPTSPAVDVAKELKDDAQLELRVVPASTGREVIIRPVTASLVDEVTSRIPDPEIPMWFNEEKQRNEPNESDPKYLKALDEANRARGTAALEAMIMFGIELVDGLPEDDLWYKKLMFMQKRGRIDLSGYDLDDDFDRMFLYLRFIVADTSIIRHISDISGLSREAVERAEESFQGNA